MRAHALDRSRPPLPARLSRPDRIRRRRGCTGEQYRNPPRAPGGRSSSQSASPIPINVTSGAQCTVQKGIRANGTQYPFVNGRLRMETH